MSAEDFVNQLQNKNNLGAEDAFKSAMTDRVAQSLEMKRREVAGTFVRNHIPEVEDNEAV